MKKMDLFLAVGQISMVLGILGFLLNTFIFEHQSTLSFFTGLCLGLSVVMNLAFFFMRKSEAKRASATRTSNPE